MKNQKQFSTQEKATFINEYLKKHDDDKFNEAELVKEKRVKAYLIMIECGILIGLLLVTTFTWKLNWVLNFNDWLTNIVVPILIFNFLNSIWMLIERKTKRIKVWVRLVFYFLSMIITFLISTSLRVEFYDPMPIWKIVISVLCALLSIFIFLWNYRINKQEATKNAEYQIAIMNEIIDDINSLDEEKNKGIDKKRKKSKTNKRKS